MQNKIITEPHFHLNLSLLKKKIRKNDRVVTWIAKQPSLWVSDRALLQLCFYLSPAN